VFLHSKQVSTWFIWCQSLRRIRARGRRYSRQGGQLKWGRLTESKMSLDYV